MWFYIFLFGQRNFENNNSEGQDWQSNNLKKYQTPNNSNFKCSQSNNMHQLICKYSREVTVATTITTTTATFTKSRKLSMERSPKSSKSAITTTLTANEAPISYATEVDFGIELTSGAVKRKLENNGRFQPKEKLTKLLSFSSKKWISFLSLL